MNIPASKESTYTIVGLAFVAIGLAVVLASCSRLTEPEMPDHKLTPLFTTSEGCTAYRFHDNPGFGATKVHYFVACKEDKTAEIIDILKEDAKLPTVKAPPRPTKKAVPK